MTWAEVAGRLVTVQRTTRLCIARDLDELAIVQRIMRKVGGAGGSPTVCEVK
jgi:autophagy-related protein 9